MALIPPDVGIRMRMQTETNLLQPVSPAHEIPSDLPELRPGQTFSARIQEALPDNTYRALVAGKQLTLQLPEGAGIDEEIQLVVIDRSAKAIIAKKVGDDGAGVAGGTEAYPFAKFSPAARMISQLLPSEGEKPTPAALNRGQPLLPQAPQTQSDASRLAPTLAKAVSQSGMFYEAHQAQWVTGKLPLEQLLQEPQGQRSAPSAFQHAAAEVAARTISTQDRPITPQTVLRALQTNDGKVGAGETGPGTVEMLNRATPSTTQMATPTQQVADELRPLVQQQLEAAATNRMAWHGEVWPRQTMELEIEWQGDREADGSNEEEMRWNTTLSLTTPRLGKVDANLRLTAAGVSITLATPYGASAADLRDESPRLAAALEAADVPLLAFHVKHEEAPSDTGAA